MSTSGRTAIGQASLEVTPLQMAMVVSAIANDGKLMQPRLTTKVVNSDGQIVETISPQVDDQVMKPKVAAELQQMMRDVVEEGTGQAANLEGLTIGGKTGHGVDRASHKDGQPLDDAWFVGFPVNNPKIAVAVELTDDPERLWRPVRCPDRGKSDTDSSSGRSMSEFDAGTIIDGRYRVLHRLGAGGMADVYLAQDEQLDREIALKLLHRRFAEDPGFVERFRREAQAAASLQHPNVVSVFDRGSFEAPTTSRWSTSRAAR